MKEILNELKSEEKLYKRTLEQLVIKRIKETSNNKFKLEEIKYWSEYFKIPMTILIFQVLQIDRENYIKMLKAQIICVESKVYTEVKSKLLKNKRKRYLENRNLNKRNYYNKAKLIKQSEIQNINMIDFAINILGKSRISLRNVMQDEKEKKRLFIGQYVNARLPFIYIEKHNEEIYAISKRNVNKVSLIKGIPMNKEDKEDLIQDCINYIIENGNMLDKKGNPIIINEFTSMHNKNRIYKKIYYYIMNTIENYREKDRYGSYIENIKYENNKENYRDEEVERCIYENINDKIEQEIFLTIYEKGNNPYTKQQILNKYNLKLEQIDEIINRNMKIILMKYT